jgi:hypothetical protein
VKGVRLIACSLACSARSMYPLLKRDRLTLQYVVWNLGWNWLVGYNPLRVTDLKLRWLGYVSDSTFTPETTTNETGDFRAHTPRLDRSFTASSSRIIR